MHFDARLRLRELTQAIYDIGDEIAAHLDNVAEAMTDWDPELVDDCLVELAEVVAEGRREVRPGLAELNGLRQAFVSGVRSGSLSNDWSAPVPGRHPGRTLSFRHPGAPAPAADRDDVGPVATTAAVRLRLRELNTGLTARVTGLSGWVVGRTGDAMDTQSVLLPQVYSRAEAECRSIVDTWRRTVIAPHPALVREMRGEAPPRFLAERARVDAVVARVLRKRAAAG